jgi:hypothetical protein
MPASYKRIALISAVVLTSIITWATARVWLSGPSLFGWTDILVPSLAVILMASVTGIAWVLLTHRWDRWAAILTSWVAFTLYWKPDIWYVSALPLFAGLWYEASRRVRDEVRNRRTLSVRASLGRGIKFILLGAFLMISVGFYLLPASRQTDLDDISRGIRGGIEDTYDTAFVRDQLNQLPPGAQAQVKRDIAQSVNDMVRKWLGPFAGYVPPILAFALFITLWSVSFIHREAAIWLGAGIWKILVMTKFITITEEDIKAQNVSL